MVKRMTERRKDKQDEDIDVVEINGTIYARIPPKLLDFLDIHENSTIKMQTEYSDQYGRYCSYWNPAQQEDGEE